MKCANCGHPKERHVKGSGKKHYCVELGCHCGDFVEPKEEAEDDRVQAA